MSSYFFLQADKSTSNALFIEQIEEYAEANKQLVYLLNKPLTDQKYSYRFHEALILLSPKHKISIINFKPQFDDDFQEYIEDIIEDIGSISDKYEYKNIIGRPRKWKNELIEVLSIDEFATTNDLFAKISTLNPNEIKKIDLLISLFIGSINDIDRVKGDIPQTILDKVKQKIQLFDGDQTRFVYETFNKKRIVIQGLSGTGKTELLLHKLKDLYVNDTHSKIYFTCHNKVLADNLRKRIPQFFNFMKVEQQIEWNTRLWCTNAWGSRDNTNSGLYRFICDFYEIAFYQFSYHMSFSKACDLAYRDITELYIGRPIPKALTYVIIDESQDFDENFFRLCELICEKNIYIAGDVFQNIFDEKISSSIEPDFLLGKCYRTDPKTLMFAHAMGMGLFEQNKLRWLEPQEWKDCGYRVQVKDGTFYLSREPLRRFEDLEDDFESIKIVEIEKSYSDTTIELIKQLINNNPTIKPDDIGIILLDSNSDVYRLADTLEFKIQAQIQWEVNKAYESKEKIENTIFLTNRNNVKGLEFPFVICVTASIKNSASYRNALYTMLTRSFIKSFLLIPNNTKSGLQPSMKEGLSNIIQSKEMVIKEPSKTEKEKIRTQFKYRSLKLSHYDLMMKIFSELKIEKKHHEKLLNLTRQLEMLEADYTTLTEFVSDNIKYLQR